MDKTRVNLVVGNDNDPKWGAMKQKLGLYALIDGYVAQDEESDSSQAIYWETMVMHMIMSFNAKDYERFGTLRNKIKYQLKHAHSSYNLTNFNKKALKILDVNRTIFWKLHKIDNDACIGKPLAEILKKLKDISSKPSYHKKLKQAYHASFDKHAYANYGRSEFIIARMEFTATTQDLN